MNSMSWCRVVLMISWWVRASRWTFLYCVALLFLGWISQAAATQQRKETEEVGGNSFSKQNAPLSGLEIVGTVRAGSPGGRGRRGELVVVVVVVLDGGGRRRLRRGPARREEPLVVVRGGRSLVERDPVRPGWPRGRGTTAGVGRTGRRGAFSRRRGSSTAGRWLFVAPERATQAQQRSVLRFSQGSKASLRTR